MPKDPQLQASSLLEDCTRLINLARNVKRQPPGNPEKLAELGQAVWHVTEALDSLRAVTGGQQPREKKIPDSSVGGIVNRILGRRQGPGREIGDSISALRQRGRKRRNELLQGHSKTVAIPDLLSFLQMQGKTGLLRVVLPSEVIAIHFEGGDLVGAISSNSPPGCLLGEILVEQGAIRQQALDSFLVYFTGDQGRLGAALELEKLVSEDQLRIALTDQVQLLFHRLLAADDAIFEFREGQLDELGGSMRLNVTQLLLESARVEDESRQRAGGTTTKPDAPPAPVAAPATADSKPEPGDPPPALPSEPSALDGPVDFDELRAEIRAREASDWSKDS